MAKRLSEKEKQEIKVLFTIGKTIDELAIKFNCTKLTISRNLKKHLGEKKYNELLENIKKFDKSSELKEKNANSIFSNKFENQSSKEIFANKEILNEDFDEEQLTESSFMEIPPLNCEIDNKSQKDLSSIPIKEIDFPKNLFMIVDKKIELDIKLLKEFPEWQFLSKEELNRKTIEIYNDLKIAKRSCNKEQRVIKVPNTDVFKIAAPFLLSKGISRIVNADKLIAL